MAYTRHKMHVFKPAWMHAERPHRSMAASEDPEFVSKIKSCVPQDCCSNAEHFGPDLASCLNE